MPATALDLLALPGLALLPPRLRDDFGIGWSPLHERVATLLGLQFELGSAWRRPAYARCRTRGRL